MQTIKAICKTALKKNDKEYRKFLFFLSEFISTGFFVGKIPFAPGTFGSLLGTIISYFFIRLSLTFQIIFLGFVLFSAILTTHLYLIKLGDKTKDPKEVVIDEVFAVIIMCFLSQIVITDYNWKHFILIFLLFRIFDILKPYPICYVDKNIHGASGIILDDILAGIAGILFFIAIFG